MNKNLNPTAAHHSNAAARAVTPLQRAWHRWEDYTLRKGRRMAMSTLLP